MSSQRKQDRWNEKKGQISKSYKLNRSVTEAFANACAHDNTSQSNKLNIILGMLKSLGNLLITHPIKFWMCIVLLYSMLHVIPFNMLTAPFKCLKIVIYCLRCSEFFRYVY